VHRARFRGLARRARTYTRIVTLAANVRPTLREEATALLQQLIRFNTVNPPGNELEAQRFLKSYLEDAGFSCELVGISAERPNLLARLGGEVSGPRLCYLCHVDTVLANPDEWSVDPWSGELREGFVWGRGALDMKGQVACEVAAAAALGRSGWRPGSGELLVVVTCDEEAGATLGARWLCENVPDKVRCDWVVNEGAGEMLDFRGRRFYTVCIGEKGVFRFTLTTDGRAGHASIPSIADNALLRMVEVLGRLDGRQPPFDRYPEAEACLRTLLGHDPPDPAAGLAEVATEDSGLADLLEPIMGVTLAPTMIRASEKENVIPSRCSVRVDCRVPPGLDDRHARRRVEDLIGKPEDGGYSLHFDEAAIGNGSALEGPLSNALRDYVETQDPGAELLPLVLPGFTDSHWFRKAFPECVAYGFFPQRAMTIFDTTPLIHAADERIDVDDLELASEFFHSLPFRLLA
jgi:acetylornithine deacetylase/succinyl-diaminopimelate desuccinylase-like protein